ncbi:MAG: hypothetical protein ACE5HV_11720 [Acidobacteriota bacterium]
MSVGQGNLELRCPCCSTKLVIERDSGEILYEERPKKAGPSWDEALRVGKEKQAEAEAMFHKGMHRERHADEILEKKFKEALKRADKSDAPPPRPFDFD